ncbi:MAG: Wzz/FepE/Etk N-terminal domain-containing protein, partial [Acidobacteriota bacterium]|nr:Wzz/FepE/Etk N-terminal domain-containing protein [Acidobacteriota bacterium]
MKETRELTQVKIEPATIERPFEMPLPISNGGFGAYRNLGATDGDFQLVTYWRIIRKRFWLVLGITVLMTTLAAIYMARKPNIYQSRAVVQIDLEQANPDLITSNDRRSAAMNQDPSYFNTQLQLLSSDNLLRRVIKELSLDSNKEFQKLKTDESVSTWRSLLKTVGLASDAPKKTERGVDEVSVSANSSLATSDEINEAVRLAPYVDIIKKNLGVEPIRESRASFKDTRLIELTFRHTDPEFAAFVVNGIGEVFSKANQDKRAGTSGKTNEFLQNRIAQLQTEI